MGFLQPFLLIFLRRVFFREQIIDRAMIPKSLVQSGSKLRPQSLWLLSMCETIVYSGIHP